MLKKELQKYDKKVKRLLRFWSDYTNKYDYSGIERLSSGSRIGQHKAKYMTIDGHRVRIDVNIYNLIFYLNKLGIRTMSCCGADCSGRCGLKHKVIKKEIIWNPKTKKNEIWSFVDKPKQCQQSAYIEFVHRTDIVKFANIVYDKSDSEEIHLAMQSQGLKNKWKWCISLRDINDNSYLDSRGYVVGKKFNSPKMDFNYLVIIPHAHIDLVTKRVSEKCNSIHNFGKRSRA